MRRWPRGLDPPLGERSLDAPRSRHPRRHLVGEEHCLLEHFPPRAVLGLPSLLAPVLQEPRPEIGRHDRAENYPGGATK
jgi:hypothetical protein